MIKPEKMSQVFAYLFVETLTQRRNKRMYHIGGLPPLTRDEAIKLAEIVNKMLDARSIHLVEAQEEEEEIPLYKFKLIG